MSRARVAALALVNWKGVFYERYLLDRHVTALEGANGAGKTTVMIAAYDGRPSSPAASAWSRACA